MIRLIPFHPDHFDTFISWIKDEESLITIAGSIFTFPLTRQQLRNYLDDPNSHSFSIVSPGNDQLIGHAEIVLSGEGIYKIDKLIVGEPSARGKGTGEKVINELLEYAFTQLHAKTVELNVFDWNASAIRCYENAALLKMKTKPPHLKQAIITGLLLI